MDSISVRDAEQLKLAVTQFNNREFYACHDTLEALWLEAIEPNRMFYQGLLQIGVGYYHLLNNNWRGALILLGEGLSRLEYYNPSYLNIDVQSLMQRSQDNQQLIQDLGANLLSQFDKERIPQVEWVDSDCPS